MTMAAELVALRNLISEDDVERGDEVTLSNLRRQHSDVPHDYFALLRDCGFGGLRGSGFILYGGPVPSASIFDS
jgi:hypothetical protein